MCKLTLAFNIFIGFVFVPLKQILKFMLIHLHPQNPQPRQIKAIVECLLDGGVIIYPTDTIYGLGCDIFHRKAVERICRIKNVDPEKAQLSFVCCDLSDLSKYTKSISTPLYRLIKNYLPGPYTFILPASKEVPKILQTKKCRRSP
jgi:tRNA threonylcarbamoyl adenosine modification protein (Sua5/YciO/YrdC/YwlC family)